MKVEAEGLVLGTLLTALGVWNVAQVVRTGAASVRSGRGEWKRSKDPELFWLCTSALALPLAMGSFMLAAGLGAPDPVLILVAVASLAGALVTVARMVPGRSQRGS